MKPKLVKNNIIIEILKKNNTNLQKKISINNTNFFNFILFSFILFGLLLLIYKYLDKINNNNKNNKIRTKKIDMNKNNKIRTKKIDMNKNNTNKNNTNKNNMNKIKNKDII